MDWVHLFDFVKYNDEIVQVIGFEFDSGIYVQDIHCKTELTHINLVSKEAVRLEDVEWFKNNTKNEKFIFIKFI